MTDDIDDDDIWMGGIPNPYGYGFFSPPQCVGWGPEPKCRMNSTVCTLKKCADGKLRCPQHMEMFNAEQNVLKSLVKDPKIPNR